MNFKKEHYNAIHIGVILIYEKQKYYNLLIKHITPLNPITKNMIRYKISKI